MKHSLPALAIGLTAILTFTATADATVPGRVDFGHFTAPSKGGEFVEVNLKGNLLSIAAKFAEKSDPEISKLVKSVSAIRVNVIGLDDRNRADTEARVEEIRRQLFKDGWERTVVAQEPDHDVGIFLKTRGEESVEGIVVTVVDAHQQVVLVNIVGDIRPEKLAEVGERFGIDPIKQLGKSMEKK